MKAKVRLTHSIELIVEGESEETITDWLNCTTPTEAKSLATNSEMIQEEYSEEIICKIKENTDVAYVI